MKAKAKFDFFAQAPNQINLKNGLIYNISQRGAPGGWSKAIDPTNGKLYFNLITKSVTISQYLNFYRT